MADRLQFVAVWITHIGTIVIRMIMGPQTGRALVAAAIGYGGGVKGVDSGPVRRQKSDMIAIAWNSGGFVEW